MKNTRVYDWPTRIFHWLFAGSFLGSFFIVKAFDDESTYFPYHMLLGLILVALVGLRVIWGFMGSRYARFSSFRLKPSELITYFKNILTGKSERFLGHNPASSWAALIMMVLAIGLGITGYLMTKSNNKELFEELHEFMADAFIVVVIAHVAGIVLHTLVHRDWIGLSMINGTKKPVGAETGITRTYGGVGIVFLALIGAFVFHLNKNYDPTRQILNFFGTTLRLGEAEENEHGEGSHQEKDDHEGGDDDDD